MTEKFAGHDIETGLLQRLRSWRDVLPPLILLQAIRVCGSPIYLSISLVSVIAISAIFTHGAIPTNIAKPALSTPFEFATVPLSWAKAVEWIAAILIGMLPAAATMRAGAIYAAGRDGEHVWPALKLISSRATAMLLVFLLPLVCIVGLAVPVALLALVDRVPTIGDWITEAFGLLIAPLVVLIGLLGAGAVVAIPIGWASLSIEKRNDPFDALSRGYEYLFRRPVQLAFYLSINLVIAVYLCWLAKWIAYASAELSGAAYSLAAGGESLPWAIRVALSHIPTAFGLTSFFAGLGGVYLLLRRDANDQEIEDIVLSVVDHRSVELPTLPTKE